ELARRFGVATPTMREVLRRLEATGAVRIRHGSGVFVQDDAPRSVIANPTRGPGSATAPLDVLEARLLIEPELAERAARRRTDADIAKLQGILGEVDRAAQAGDEEARSAASMQFHATVAEVAGNVVLAEAVRAITEIYGDYQLQIAELYADPQRDQEEHSAILAAISAGQPQKARRLMTAHLSEVYDIVSQRLGSKSPHGRRRA
ncbi:MAG TPA: FCD domain-containing protein, partial [Mycobacteriales bacterium]|nr:FCD domain-containing protein [Mycobacteriales bacterium]